MFAEKKKERSFQNALFRMVTRTKPDSVSQSYGLRSEIRGISHGLKNSPPDCFSPRCAGPAFRFPHTS